MKFIKTVQRTFLLLLVAALLSISCSSNALAQENFPEDNQVQMATGLRAEGKIYVVVVVLVTVVLGFLIYLFVLDRRVSKLERQLPVAPDAELGQD